MRGGVVGLHRCSGLGVAELVECLSHGYCCFALMKRAPNSASAAEDITARIICEILRTAPLFLGISSSVAINMWPPARLRAFGSDR